tara:strand:- start:250 stop:930 length:681 start_codon:yes stop_codon:yes gene_type:complete
MAQKNNKQGLFVGYSACPPIMNVYTLLKNKERNCNKLNNFISKLTIEKNIKNIILISRWTYYTDGQYSGSGKMNYLNLKPARSGNKKNSKIAFAKGINSTVEMFNKLGKNVYIIEQAPLQKISAEAAYYRSVNKNLNKLKENLIKHSIDINKHVTFQNFVKNIFKQNAKNYDNLTIVSLDDIFCDKKINKCLIGNEKESFYIDYHHLSSKGANLAENKINNIMKNF